MPLIQMIIRPDTYLQYVDDSLMRRLRIKLAHCMNIATEEVALEVIKPQEVSGEVPVIELRVYYSQTLVEAVVSAITEKWRSFRNYRTHSEQIDLDLRTAFWDKSVEHKALVEKKNGVAVWILPQIGARFFMK